MITILKQGSDKIEEIWKDLKGYEKYYSVSNMGRIKSKSRIIVKSNGVKVNYEGKILSPIVNSDGYRQFKLYTDNGYKTTRLHRAIAETFIPNPNNLPEVNHKDCNRENNRVDNLEWCDHKYNVHYAIKNGNHICCKDLYGENNPNYHNDTLKKRYEQNPELKQLLARKGSQNGTARKVALYDNKMCFIKSFDWIGGCAQYLIDNQSAKTKNINSIRERIRICIKENKLYCNHYFKYI